MTHHTSSMDRRSLLRGSVTVAGAAIVLPSLATLGGCSSVPPTLEKSMTLISVISDRIIPETDTGGALAANVPSYIAAVYEKHFTEEQQGDFVSGLSDISGALSDAGIQFVDTAEPADVDAVLQRLDDDGNETWQLLRDLTVFGFYTSETATKELAYEEIPGRYDGCVPLAEVGSAWLARGV